MGVSNHSSTNHLPQETEQHLASSEGYKYG